MVETADTLLENFDEKYKKQNKNEPNILSVYTTGLQNTASTTSLLMVVNV